MSDIENPASKRVEEMVSAYNYLVEVFGQDLPGEYIARTPKNGYVLGRMTIRSSEQAEKKALLEIDKLIEQGKII